MNRGLTDKESLAVAMKHQREVRSTWARIKDLATTGLRDPHQLTPDETREMCGSLLGLMERRERP